MFDMTRMRRRVGGIFVCAAAAVATALGGHLLLLGTFPTAWFATDRKPEMPPKEAISMDQLDPEQIAGLLKRGGELIAAGDVSLARLVLKRAAEAGNASAALELGATYDPFLIKELTVPTPLERSAKLIGGAPRDDSDEAVSSRWWASPGWLAFSGMDVSVSDLSIAPDIEMAGSWYQKAKDLGSTEAQGRLDGLAGRER
jgi:TPR repeat protein